MSKTVTLALGAIAALVAASAAIARQPIFVVNSVDDSRVDACDAAHCTLREAIIAANLAGAGEIRFGLPRWDHRYELRAGKLPSLEDHVFVVGDSQPGAECPLPVIQIDGSALPPDEVVNGLEILGDDNRVRGLSITNFTGHGVLVDGDENELTCLFVGVGPAGTGPEGNGGHGIAVTGGHSNRIGGPDAEDGNLLSDNVGYGVYIEDALNTYRNHNALGVDITGNPKLPNGDLELGALNPPPPPSALDPRAQALVTARVESRIADIAEEHAAALEQAGLLEKYVRLLEPDPTGAPPPDDLAELMAALVRQPDLYADFTADAGAVLAEARLEAAAELARLGNTFGQALPGLLRDALELPEDQRDPLAETLAAFPPDDYVLSQQPSEILAVETDPAIGLTPLHWHSLETYGPTSLSTPLNNIPIIRTCFGPTTLCFWPIAYDLLPYGAELLWETTFTEQEVEDIVLENGYFLRLSVNGQLLQGGPFPIDPNSFQSYYAATVPGEPCPTGKRCIATNVLVRKRLRNVPQPWTFKLEVLQLAELAMPIIGGIDQFGNLIIITHESQLVAQATRVVLPNQTTGGQSWFTAALFPTFQHPRCADCHGFGTFAALAAHHGYGGNPQAFIDNTNLHLEPSAYVPGKHVMVCTNCHYLPLTDPHGQPFHEIEWIAPYQDLDVNWAQKTAAQACARVLANLPTKALREEHFHGDARLFWAVQDPFVPGVGTLSKAPPQDWGEFQRRFEFWNIFGAPCP